MNTLKTIGMTLCAVFLSTGVFAQTDTETDPGYIFVTGWYKDAGVQRQYNQAVGPVLRDNNYEASFLGLDGINMRVIEGDWIPGRIMLIKFPSEDHAERFWWSKEYQEAKKIRLPVSALDIAQVDGVPGVKPLIDGKAAYLVFLVDIIDRATFVRDYAPFAPALVRKHGGQFIVSSTRANTELLEGTIPNASLVIVEFPNVQAMNDFWNDPEYQRLSEIRKATGKWSVAEVTPAPQ